MTNKKILEKAISIAIANGFEYKHENDERHEAIFYCDAYQCLIFDHNFAKAFWGKDRYYHINEGTIDGFTEEDELTLEFIKNEDEEHLINNKSSYHWYQPKWQYHLQQLVLCEKPLKYIEQFLEKEK